MFHEGNGPFSVPVLFQLQRSNTVAPNRSLKLIIYIIPIISIIRSQVYTKNVFRENGKSIQLGKTARLSP
jgi:hypothetical protein